MTTKSVTTSSIVIENISVEAAEDELFRMCASFGDVLGMQELQRDGVTKSFRVEFGDLDDAEACMENMTGMRVRDRFISVAVAHHRQ